MKKPDGEFCCSHIGQQHTLARENETGCLNFLHVYGAKHGTRSRVLGKWAIIFDIAVTFGHCHRAINKGVATLGYTYVLAHSLIMNNFPSLYIWSEIKAHLQLSANKTHLTKTEEKTSTHHIQGSRS